MKQKHLTPEFVEFMPEQLNEGLLYVSMKYAFATHKCACGCGREVATPLSPTDWQLHFDGRNVSLKPSIGNWNFPCRSHYWIRGGNIEWAGDMPQWAIDEGRANNKARKAKYYAPQEPEVLKSAPEQQALPLQQPKPEPAKKPWWERLAVFIFGNG